MKSLKRIVDCWNRCMTRRIGGKDELVSKIASASIEQAYIIRPGKNTKMGIDYDRLMIAEEIYNEATNDLPNSITNQNWVIAHPHEAIGLLQDEATNGNYFAVVAIKEAEDKFKIPPNVTLHDMVAKALYMRMIYMTGPAKLKQLKEKHYDLTYAIAQVRRQKQSYQITH